MNDLAKIEQTSQQGGAPMIFTFGDPESVLDRRELTQYFEVWHNGRWYEPPLPMDRLALAFNMSPHHRSAVAMKVNMLVNQQIPTRWLDAENFERTALDFIQMGNCYLEWVPNNANRIARAKHSPARQTRRGIKPDAYLFVGDYGINVHEYPVGYVWHLQQADVGQEIYGLPEWLSALQSGLLNENATLFRRRYYLNGAHMGFILYLNEALADNKTSEKLEAALGAAKGVGNFKNMLLHIPGGKKDGVQLLPIGEVMAKDDYASVKNVSRDDLLAAHRVPPQLIGIVPVNNAGFGSVEDAREDFYMNEVIPLILRLRRANAFFGVELMTFRDYICKNGDHITQDGVRIPAAQAR